MEDQVLTIGQVAKKTGIGIETIRYYERMKLIPHPKRNPSGYRQYCPTCVQRLKFIKNAKKLGFSLNEIADFLSLRIKSRSKCSDMKRRTDHKITEIDEKIKRLQKIKRSLKRLSDKCKDGTAPLSQCPILEEFNT